MCPCVVFKARALNIDSRLAWIVAMSSIGSGSPAEAKSLTRSGSVSLMSTSSSAKTRRTSWVPRTIPEAKADQITMGDFRVPTHNVDGKLFVKIMSRVKDNKDMMWLFKTIGISSFSELPKDNVVASIAAAVL